VRVRRLAPGQRDDDADVARIDRDFRKRAQAVLAVDQLIGALQAAVAAIGEASNTYFVFSSDNGYHMGEHRLMPGKMTAYDTDIHVPLVVTAPGVPAGWTVEQIVENVDLAPTFSDLAGTVIPAAVDGRSLVPLLRGQEVAGWKTAALIEHRGPQREAVDPDLPGPRSGNPTTYEAMRTRTFLYIEYVGGEKAHYDLATDPYELRNSFASLSGEAQAALREALQAMRSCLGAPSCWLAGRASRSPGP